MVDKYVIMEPVEKAINGEIGFLFTYSMTCGVQQPAQVADVGRQARQVMFGDVPAHLDVAVTRNTQVRYEINGVQIHALRRELALKPVCERLYLRTQVCNIPAELRIETNLT